ncbi:MAG TPA: hypothetical protein VJU84_18570 [Pyrinomonadaceae bacterium]|nr:hypothetical protein [Pyrinomonadaceae bacterium]
MKAGIAIAGCLLAVCLSSVSPAIPLTQQPNKREHFSALAYMPAGAGVAMVGAGARVNVDLRIKSYTSDEEARTLAGLLVDGGPDALLKALKQVDSKGNITITGRVGFYDFKLIRSHRTPTGRRIYAVGDRPVGFLEAYHSGRSRDYEFGILQLDLKQKSNGDESGEGALIYAAKIKLLDGNKLDVETYGIEPVRLLGVRKL